MISVPIRRSDRPALIDDDDVALASRSWRLDRDGYAYTRVYAGKRNGRSFQRAAYMHRLILGLQRGDSLEGDHINRDRLDNRRGNLRIVDDLGQAQNRGPRPPRSPWSAEQRAQQSALLQRIWTERRATRT